MKSFSELFMRLDGSTATNAKLEALIDYFRRAPPEDAAWAVYFLAGGKPRQVVRTASLRQIACELAGLPDWLFEECYQAVGDLAETIAHVLPPPKAESEYGLAYWIEQRLLPLRGATPEQIETALSAWWNELNPDQRFLLIKLIGGGFRVGVSKLLVQRALAQIAADGAGIDAKIIAQRMMGWTDKQSTPTALRYQTLLTAPAQSAGIMQAASGEQSEDYDTLSQPYPFFLAHALQTDPATLGPLNEWLVEWKYDGIRGQLVKRGGRLWLWSRGEELVSPRFPEIDELVEALPDGTVIDGEILVWHAVETAVDTDSGADSHIQPADGPAPFADLQTRIGRKLVSKKILEEKPVRLLAYDLIEQQGVDLRSLPQQERRVRLEQLVSQCAHSRLLLSPLIEAESWTALAEIRKQARSRGMEGFMLKRRDARYGVGRTKSDGSWWKWKIDPLSVDAVLIYAQAGHGRRASLYTDYTFAVWDRPLELDKSADQSTDKSNARTLVPFAKAYSGLSDEEIKQVDAIIRSTTVEKFGPVRSLKPTLVFELGFEGIQRSARHKSGIAVRFPRMLRWRLDKPVEEADTLQDLQALLSSIEAPKVQP